ncbi:MAG: hypothetical protein OEM62_09905, partial [Acidobacteriota bacterium]|nr:hypothetical protein [Acidobacteriota bacterium]
MIWTFIALLALAGSPDPRVNLIEAHLAGDPRRALEIAESLLNEDPSRGHEMGLDYLRGDLLEQLGRPRQADQAFADAMTASPRLAAYGRFRLASSQDGRGHPEVAAGLLATLLANNPPPRLVTPAARLIAHTLARGGDCRLLRGSDAWPLRGESRRLVEIASADCEILAGSSDEAMARLIRLLEESIVDQPAHLAAERLHRHFSSALSEPDALLLVGRAFHHQRQFDLALLYLRRGLDHPDRDDTDAPDAADARYAVARSHFWRSEYLQAVTAFGRVAADASLPAAAAGALYQQGRSYELHGSWDAAANSFRQAYMEDTASRWAGPALLSTLRLEWRRGREREALALFEVLGSRRSWAELYGRAALFMASSDIVQGRYDRAAGFLAEGRKASPSLKPLADLWTGRLEEHIGPPDAAVRAYLEVVAPAPFHPLAQLARARLQRDELRVSALSLARGGTARSDIRSLFRAWLLLEEDPAADDVLKRAIARLQRTPSAKPFLAFDFIAPSSWPLWSATLREPEELLLAMGLWREGEAALHQHFPISDVSLGYTASRLLVRGGAHRSALRLAEVIHNGAAARLPEPFVPVPLRRAAYPLPYGTLISEAAARHGVDPYLLTALIR